MGLADKLVEDDHWIEDSHMKKGALHKALGYSEDEKIPTEELHKAVEKGGHLAKMAQAALNMRESRPIADAVLESSYPENYGKPTGKYETKKDQDGNYRFYRKGSTTSDGQLKFTKQQANMVLKYYEGLEYSTGEIRTYLGHWWPGIPYIEPKDRKPFGKKNEGYGEELEEYLSRNGIHVQVKSFQGYRNPMFNILADTEQQADKILSLLRKRKELTGLGKISPEESVKHRWSVQGKVKV